jgi:hypothetical protein
MMISVYAMESVLLRARKLLSSAGEEKASRAIAMTTAFVHEQFALVEGWAKEALASLAEGDVLRTQLSILKKLTRVAAVNLTKLKRGIAAPIIAGEKYIV